MPAHCHVAYFILMPMCSCILPEYSYVHLVDQLSYRFTVCVAHLFSQNIECNYPIYHRPTPHLLTSTLPHPTLHAYFNHSTLGGQESFFPFLLAYPCRLPCPRGFQIFTHNSNILEGFLLYTHNIVSRVSCSAPTT